MIEDLDLALPITLERDPGESTSSFVGAALFALEEADVLTYREPVDMRSKNAREWMTREAGDYLHIPAEVGTPAAGQYHLMYLAAEGGDRRQAIHPALILQNEVIGFVRRHYALNIAHKLGLLTYLRPLDARAPEPARMLQEVFFDRDTVFPTPDQPAFLVRVKDKPMLVQPQDVFTVIRDLQWFAAAEPEGLLTFAGPADMDKASDRSRLSALFDCPLPEGRQFYLVTAYVPPGNPAGVNILIPAGDARAQVFMLAAAAGGRDLAERFAYIRGMLPR